MNDKVTNFLIGLSALVFMGLLMAFSFYLFMLLLPIVLFGALAYAGFYLYCSYKAKNGNSVCPLNENKASDIIDIEYEIVDDDK